MKLPRSNYADKLRDLGDVVLADDAAAGRRGCWGDLFRARIGPAEFDGRVVLEIGCFDADFLSRVAAKHPQTAFVGLDWKAKPIHDGARRIAERAQRNVVLIRGRGQDAFEIFAEREVDDVWVFHPDPFATPGELKHRLINEPFLNDVHAVLRDGSSTLTLKTDHAGYYQWVLGLFGLPQPAWFGSVRLPTTTPRVRGQDLTRPEDLPSRNEVISRRFNVTATSADFWNDPAALSHVAGRCFAGERTSFETRFVKKRLPIYYLEMSKR